MKKHLAIITVSILVFCGIAFSAFKNVNNDSQAKYVIVIYNTAFREVNIYRGNGVKEKIKASFNLMNDPAKLELAKTLEKLGNEQYEIISVNTHNIQSFADSPLSVEYVYTLELK
jgi:uncharacterized protein YxeA